MSSPDAFLLFTRPQIVSRDSPRKFFRMDRFISLKLADFGSSNLAATAIFALSTTGSVASEACTAGAGSTFAATGTEVAAFPASTVLPLEPADNGFTAAIRRAAFFVGVGVLGSDD